MSNVYSHKVYEASGLISTALTVLESAAMLGLAVTCAPVTVPAVMAGAVVKVTLETGLDALGPEIKAQVSEVAENVPGEAKEATQTLVEHASAVVAKLQQGAESVIASSLAESEKLVSSIDSTVKELSALPNQIITTLSSHGTEKEQAREGAGEQLALGEGVG